MSEPSIVSERSIHLKFLMLLMIIVLPIFGYYLLVTPKNEIVFPTQSQSGLVKNELISDELSRLIRDREKIEDVSAISAVLVDTGFFNNYDIEFTFNDGRRTVGHSSIQAGAYGIPESFRADRLTSDYMEFTVMTDGKEYKVAPDTIYFLRFYALIEDAYKDMINTDREMIKAQWQKGIDQVNSRKAEKSESMTAE